MEDAVNCPAGEYFSTARPEATKSAILLPRSVIAVGLGCIQFVWTATTTEGFHAGSKLTAAPSR